MRHVLIEVRGDEIWDAEFPDSDTDIILAARLRFILDCPLTLLAMDIRPSELVVKEVEA